MRWPRALFWMMSGVLLTGVALAQTPAPSVTPAPMVPVATPAASPEKPSRYVPAALARAADPGWLSLDGPSSRTAKKEQAALPFPAATPETAMSRYLATVRAAVGKAWFTKMDRDFAKTAQAGKIDVHFWVSPAGKVTDVRIVTLAGQKHELADATAAALETAEILPMSAELAATLPKKGVEMDLKFDLY